MKNSMEEILYIGEHLSLSAVSALVMLIRLRTRKTIPEDMVQLYPAVTILLLLRYLVISNITAAIAQTITDR